MLLLQRIKCYLPKQKGLHFEFVHLIFCPCICHIAPFFLAQVVIFLSQVKWIRIFSIHSPKTSLEVLSLFICLHHVRIFRHLGVTYV